MTIHLESGICDTGVTLRDLDNYTHNNISPFAEGLGRPNLYSCGPCNTRFTHLSALFQHAESPSCSQGYGGLTLKHRNTIGEKILVQMDVEGVSDDLNEQLREAGLAHWPHLDLVRKMLKIRDARLAAEQEVARETAPEKVAEERRAARKLAAVKRSPGKAEPSNQHSPMNRIAPRQTNRMLVRLPPPYSPSGNTDTEISYFTARKCLYSTKVFWLRQVLRDQVGNAVSP